jgi:hypothetical protein
MAPQWELAYAWSEMNSTIAFIEGAASLRHRRLSGRLVTAHEKTDTQV